MVPFLSAVNTLKIKATYSFSGFLCLTITETANAERNKGKIANQDNSGTEVGFGRFASFVVAYIKTAV